MELTNRRTTEKPNTKESQTASSVPQSIEDHAAEILTSWPATDESLLSIDQFEPIFELGRTIQAISQGEEQGQIAVLGKALVELGARLSGKRSIPPSVGKKVLQVLQFLSAGGKEWTQDEIGRHEEALHASLKISLPDSAVVEQRILVVDDDPVAQMAIGDALRRGGFVPISCLKATEALERLRVERPAVIVLDVEMPDIRGPQLLRMIRKDACFRGTPVIFVSANKNLDARLDALRHGADDYIAKPFDPEELITRVAARLERGLVLQEIAFRDPLTGMASHRFFHESLSEELDRYARYKNSFVVGLLDVDNLGKVNASFGSAAGDRALVRVAEELRHGLRRADLVARLAGGEFGVIMTQTRLEGARVVLSRVFKRLSHSGGYSAPDVSLSAGLAGCPETTSKRRAVLTAARDALESAKRQGEGCLVCAPNAQSVAESTEAASTDQDQASEIPALEPNDLLVLARVFVRETGTHFRELDDIDNRTSVREQVMAFRRIGHFLAGAGGLAGYSELSSLGETVERNMEIILSAGTVPVGTTIMLGELLEAMRRIGAGLRMGTYDPAEVVDLERRLPRNRPGESTEQDESLITKPDVLVVDDEEVSHVAIEQSLGRAGYSIRSAYTGAEAMAAMSEKEPDIILLDLMLPDTDGHAILAQIRANPRLRLVPVILVSVRHALEDKVRSLSGGADDYITKPFVPEEMVARVAARLERAQIAKELAMRDGLTCLYNHRFFQERLDHEIARSGRYQNQCSLALLDIDDFKSVNDRFGHQTGDAVLRALAGHMLKSLRATDVVARYGGEEFAIIYTETAFKDAKMSFERLRVSVAKETLAWEPEMKNPIRITFSGGLVNVCGGTKNELIARADAALYESKKEGKNRITAKEQVASE